MGGFLLAWSRLAWSRRAWTAGVVLLALAGVSSEAQERALRPVRVVEKRALLIGNADYEGASRLVNTIPDVRALEGALEALEFDGVSREENLTLRQMMAAVRRFTAGLDAGDLALFYYSGHGVQVSNENYLLPVDYERETQPGEVAYAALSVKRVQDMLKGTGAKVRVLVLDACRNNPYGDGRSAGGGLAPMDAEGDLIVYSTGAGDVASDNQSGELGLYMTHLLPELRGERVELKEAFDRTRAAVYEAARARGESQRPAQYEDLIGRVYLRGGPGGLLAGAAQTVPVAPPLPPAVRTTPAASGMTAAERWGVIKGTESLEDLKTYIENYRGDPEAAVFVSLAGVRLKAMEKKLQEKAAAEEQQRLARAARASWEAVLEADNREVLGTFVHVYGKVAAVADLVEQAKGRLKELSPILGMEFMWIPPGEFRMGSTGSLTGYLEEPVTQVRISRGFYLGKHEVTQGQWEAVMGSNPSHFKNCGGDCPVESVSWEDVQAFIRRLNEWDGGGKYRLPTEAEWEYAARAGTQTDTHAGDLRIQGKRNAPLLNGIAWYGGNSGVNYEGGWDCSEREEKQYRSERCGPHPVGRKAPNAFGLYDMLGNVWEWVGDWYGEYPGGRVTDPVGPRSGSYRVIRGGSWFNYARYCRSANRNYNSPGHRYFNLGFRLLRTE